MNKTGEQKGRRLVISIYYHPESYPPTLNAVRELSSYFKDIIIVHRPHLKYNWEYPTNVMTIPSGKPISSMEQVSASTFQKIGFFYRFVRDFYKQCKMNKPDIILLYDTIPLLAYRLIRPFLRFRHKLWYHNHDIVEIERMRKYSFGWFASKAERKIFSRLDLFTLPAASRLPFFSMNALNGSCIIIPNYPSRFVFEHHYQPRKIDAVVRLIFQGRVGEGHGLEEIISLLPSPLEGKRLELVLVGYCSEEYKKNLQTLANRYGVSNSISFKGLRPYREVPALESQCHIGIGIYASKQIMHLTMGTSSNKLFEYAALGLPVLYLREKHFTDYLHNYDWAVPVELNSTSIRNAVAEIIKRYEQFSTSAHQTFVATLNFEESFKPVIAWLNNQ